MTVPTSRTSTEDLIRLELRLEHLADRACGDLRHLCLTSLRAVASAWRMLSSCDGDAPVQHAAGDVDDDAAEDRRRRRCSRSATGVPSEADELLGQARAQRVVERHGGGDLGRRRCRARPRRCAPKARPTVAELVGHARARPASVTIASASGVDALAEDARAGSSRFCLGRHASCPSSASRRSTCAADRLDDRRELSSASRRRRPSARRGRTATRA